MDVLMLSLGRKILERGSRERVRTEGYAKALSSLHIIVLTRREYAVASETHEGTLHLYPTNSRSRFMMPIDAFRIALRVVETSRTEPLVVSAQDPFILGWVCRFLTLFPKTRLHIQVHGDYFAKGWAGRSLFRHFIRLFALILLKSAPAVRVVSERIKTSLVRRGVHADRITVLPIRPELESFLAVERVTRSEPPVRFLYVGRLAPEKDLPRILCAFAETLSRGCDATLRIIGEGDERKRLEALIGSLRLAERVHILPWTADVPAAMAESDVLLLASKHEAYALVLVEAMAAGRPVVTTDVGCVGEVVEDNVHGIVVRDEGISPYAAAILRMCVDADFRRTCGERGRERARELARSDDETYVRGWVTALSRAL